MDMNGAKLQRPGFDGIRVRRVAERVFRNYTGSLGVRLWDGTAITLGRDDPPATVVVHSARVLRALAWRPDPLRLAEAYFSGEIDAEGDLYGLLAQRNHLQSLRVSMRDRLALFSAAAENRASRSRMDTLNDCRWFLCASKP